METKAQCEEIRDELDNVLLELSHRKEEKFEKEAKIHYRGMVPGVGIGKKAAAKRLLEVEKEIKEGEDIRNEIMNKLVKCQCNKEKSTCDPKILNRFLYLNSKARKERFEKKAEEVKEKVLGKPEVWLDKAKEEAEDMARFKKSKADPSLQKWFDCECK